ncbi:unnamed protein product [Paramecium octaurelia]|uniref:Uncharacterized protein n=2 Tax=Paramecium octaurelia TaxID=43137 RepID=A0A8S1YLG4_PAROT|nr:unnamed protein product [Paramecium octaurelia]
MLQHPKQSTHKFEILPETTTKINYSSYANAINLKKTLIIIGTGRKIQVYEIPYINGEPKQLKLIQKLKEHSNDVLALQFFNLPQKNDSFVSGAAMVDNSIIIWSQVQNPNSPIQYGMQYRLKGHQDQVSNLLIHPIREDIIISGSQDSTIKFWSKDHEWSCQQTMNEFKTAINGMAINNLGDQFVSCSKEKLIIVMRPDQQFQWSVKQRIKFPQEVFRLCFITNDLLAILPHMGTQLHFFAQNEHQHFVKSLDHLNLATPGEQCFPLFPPCYSPITETLIIKNGNKVNVVKFSFLKSKEGVQIRESEGGWTCKLEQVIEYVDYFLFGSMSKDGEYLVSYLFDQLSIQIRKYTMQE